MNRPVPQSGNRAAADARIGPGTLVLVCGPSGAGKDSLMRGARDLVGDTGQVTFARRIVSRPVSDFEDHDSVADAEFDRLQARGALAFWWQAHGLKYGVPVSVDDAIKAGHCVVCNVSRTMIGDLKRRYRNAVAVAVTAPADVLAARLAARGRTSDGAVSDRVARSAAIGDVSVDVVIDNAGSIDDGARRLKAVIDAAVAAAR